MSNHSAGGFPSTETPGGSGLAQIRQGMAWHYKEYQHEQTTHDRLVYRDEEDSAKARQVGLWKDAKPLAPWEWRKQRANSY